MFYIWRAAWKRFFEKFKRQLYPGISLTSVQMQAFVDLQACFLVRGEEIATQYPEISFLLKALGEDGQDWEWFPDWQKLQKDALASLPHLIHSINQDLKTYPYNY
ncbi:MAG TPA: hypothetical protein VGE40_12815, partial [Bacilli bacterium]